jgi:transposase
MERATRATWTARVERWRDSGLSAAEFAAELGINPHTLKWWKWHLGAKASPPAPKRALARRESASIAKSTPQISPLTFVELTAAVVGDPLEVVLPSTVRVRVPRGFDSATLVRLLDVLEPRR